jgi:heme A synthase
MGQNVTAHIPQWLKNLTLGNVAFTIVVILWGALVRKTHSGAGCGDHWPLCNGKVVPLAPSMETFIEFTHRLTSGMALIGVLVAWVACLRFTPKGHDLRRYSFGALAFMVIEALIGAGIVIFGLVERNDSTLRAAVIGVHLANTFVLLGYLALAALVAVTGRQPRLRVLVATPSRFFFYMGYAALLIVIAAFGAITALGNTLFPASSLIDGMVAKKDLTAHFLERLTIIHPMVAIFGGLSLIGLLQVQLASASETHLDPKWRRPATMLTYLILGNLVVGALDIALLAPIAVSTLHLLLADLIWLAYMWYGFERAGCLAQDASAQGSALRPPITSNNLSKDSP